MENRLNDTEARVLGSLLEKEMATPDYYPLSLLALTNACNQKSNREPVVFFDEETVVRALHTLQDKKMVRQSSLSRVPKYEQTFTASQNMVAREAAILSVLLLRGPQTSGEIRSRTSRLYAFADLAEVTDTLRGLEEMELIVQLARQPGRKESRYAHLLCPTPAEPEINPRAKPEPAALRVEAENARLAEITEEISRLRQEVHALKTELDTFKAQFD